MCRLGHTIKYFSQFILLEEILIIHMFNTNSIVSSLSLLFDH